MELLKHTAWLDGVRVGPQATLGGAGAPNERPEEEKET